MLNKKIQISISSPPDREKLVADIFIGNRQFAEVNQDGEELKIEIYNNDGNEPWSINLLELMTSLKESRKKLMDSIGNSV